MLRSGFGLGLGFRYLVKMVQMRIRVKSWGMEEVFTEIEGQGCEYMFVCLGVGVCACL